MIVLKKALALTLAVFAVICTLPAPDGVFAAEKAVYLSERGEGDGSTPEKALGTFEKAYAALGEDGGQVVIVGTYELSTGFTAPSHKGKITITGSYNGTDHKGEIHATNTSASGMFRCGGETVFENITLRVAGNWVVLACFNHLTFGDGVITKSDVADHGEFPRIFVAGGDQGAKSKLPTDGNTHLTFKSGTFYEVMAGPRSGSPSDYTGLMVTEVTGTAAIYKLSAAGRSASNTDYGSALLILDGGKVQCWAGGHDSKSCGMKFDTKFVITKNFDISASFNDLGTERIFTNSGGSKIFYGISGSSVFVGKESATLFAHTWLLVDPAVKSAVMASGKINTDGFTDIKDFEYTGTIGSGKLEGRYTDEKTEDTSASAAVTSAAETTEALSSADAVSDDAAIQPQSGGKTLDVLIVVLGAVAVAMCVAATVVICRKKVKS